MDKNNLFIYFKIIHKKLKNNQNISYELLHAFIKEFIVFLYKKEEMPLEYSKLLTWAISEPEFRKNCFEIPPEKTKEVIYLLYAFKEYYQNLSKDN